MGQAITIHPITTGDPCTHIPSTGPGRSLTGLAPFGTRIRAGITAVVPPMVPTERWAAQLGITRPLEDMGEPPQPRLGMEGEQPRRPTTPGRADTALPGRVTVPTRSGGDRPLCGATIGCGPDTSLRVEAPWVVFRVLEALPLVLVVRVAAR